MKKKTKKKTTIIISRIVNEFVQNMNDLKTRKKKKKAYAKYIKTIYILPKYAKHNDSIQRDTKSIELKAVLKDNAK